VVEIAGAYYAEGVINTCLVGGDCSANQLTVKGLLVAGQFLFNRQFTDEYDSPAEEIIYDGRILANTPPGMYDLVKGLPLWQNY